MPYPPTSNTVQPLEVAVGLTSWFVNGNEVDKAKLSYLWKKSQYRIPPSQSSGHMEIWLDSAHILWGKTDRFKSVWKRYCHEDQCSQEMLAAGFILAITTNFYPLDVRNKKSATLQRSSEPCFQEFQSVCVGGVVFVQGLCWRGGLFWEFWRITSFFDHSLLISYSLCHVELLPVSYFFLYAWLWFDKSVFLSVCVVGVLFRAVSTFWIANPNNNLISNAAAGSQVIMLDYRKIAPN